MLIKGCCPHDCQDACAWVAHVEDGKVMRVDGAKEHPVTRGTLCAKVKDYETRLSAPGRVLHPLRRTGAKGSGQFEPISWDTALGEIAARFTSIITEHGAGALLPYHYLGSMGTVQRLAPMRIFHALGSSLAVGDVCAASAGALMAEGHPINTDTEDAADAKLVVIWGQNTLSTGHHQWHFVNDARKRGAKIIGIDPRATRTMKQCDHHLAPRPGSDAALAAAVGRHLLATGRIDGALASMWVADLDDYRRQVEPWTFQAAAAATGLAESEIADFATTFAKASPVLIRAGVGLQQAVNGEQVMRAISALAILGGHWRHHGGGLSILNFADYDPSAAERSDLRAGEARILPGSKLAEVLTSETLSPPVKGFMVWCANPAATQIDTARMVRGLLRPDLFTVVADHFITDTARHADIVLPATTQLEHLDVQGSWGHHYVLANTPAIAPMGEARSSGAIMRGLAEKLGLSHPAFEESDAEIAASSLPQGWPLDDLLRDGWRKAPAARPAMAPLSRKLRLADGGITVVPPADDQLQMLTPKAHYFLNSTFANMARQRGQEGKPVMHMHGADLAARGLVDGARVKVRTGSASLELTVAASNDVRRGCAWLDGKWWNDEAGANALTPSRWSPAGQPAYNEVLVTVEAV